MFPKIEYPTINIELKSIGKSVLFRPMLVKEEKLLLMAKESQAESDIFSAVKQVVTNCCLDSKLNIDKIPLFELEYIFLVLRMQSINNVVELSYHDNEDNQDYKFNVNLETIKITYPSKKINNKIKIANTNVGLVLRYPPASLYSNSNFLNAEKISDSFDEIFLNSVEEIFDEENVYPVDISTPSGKAELVEFLNQIDSVTYKKINEFFENTPHMEHTIEYKNKNGTERKIVLRTLNDFFIL